MADAKNESNWQPTAKRFITFLDIMGFKELVLRSSHKEIYELLSELSQIRSFVEKIPDGDDVKDAEIYTASFSDSIILFSKNNSIECFKAQIYASSWLFAKSIEKNIPMKGAIAYGEISLNKSKQIYFGQPLIDAYLLEEELNYYGIIAHHSLVKFVQDNKNDINLDRFLFEAPAPLKGGLITHTHIDWFADLTGPTNDKEYSTDFKEIFKNKIETLSGTVSGLPRKYLDNTVKVFEDRYEK